jgi:hypothetical protein
MTEAEAELQLNRHAQSVGMSASELAGHLIRQHEEHPKVTEAAVTGGDLGDLRALHAEVHGRELPTLTTGVVILELEVPDTWVRDGGQASLISAIETVMNANDLTLFGPGGAVLKGLFARVEYGEKAEPLRTHCERLRREYPLEQTEIVRDMAGAGYRVPLHTKSPWQRQLCGVLHPGLTCEQYESAAEQQESAE